MLFSRINFQNLTGLRSSDVGSFCHWRNNLIGFTFLLLFPFCVWSKPQEIIFWHSMAGQLGEELRTLTEEFNQKQSDYNVRLVYKGNYIESLTSFSAAFRAKHPPNMIQVFEVGTPVMLFPKGIIKPVDQVMSEQGFNLSKENYYKGVYQNYSQEGKLVAMPLNVSVPVLFYNADILRSQGISSENFPKTWDGLETLLTKLKRAGHSCGYTTAYPSWILIESYSALNGLTSAEGNLLYENTPQLLAHINRLRRWQQHHYFEYGGRVDDATVLFTSGKCPLFSQSSGAFASLSQLVPFHVGVAPLPMDSRITDTRHNNVVGGAAIWITSGQSATMERGIAKFFDFLSDSRRQQTWYERTGYLPFVSSGQSFLKKWPSAIIDIASLDLNHDNILHILKPIPQNQIRMINDAMLDAIFSGIVTPEEGLRKAGIRIEEVIFRFRKNILF